MAQTTGIDHIVIHVYGLEDVKKFFLKGLGLPLHADYGKEFFVEVGEQTLGFCQGDTRNPNPTHIAIKVDSLEAMKERLTRTGYKVLKNNMVSGPEGVRVQLMP